MTTRQSPPDSTVHVAEDEVLPAFAAVFGEHRHNCATLSVKSGRGDFSTQLATATDFDGAVWNIASDPPQTRVKGYEELDRGDVFVVLDADASTPAEALVELRDIAGQIGGEHSRARLEETMRMATGDPVDELIDRVRALVNRGGQA